MDEQLLKFHTIGDERGYLVSLEENRNIPFSIKRVYYIYGTNDQPRGFHAHKELQQMLVCVSGSCKVKIDDGNSQSIFTLSTANEGLFVDKMIWHEMYEFSENCVLLVLASDYYEEEDYIRDYEDFKELIKVEKIDITYFKHEKAIVESSKIGDATRIWAFSHILPRAVIGRNCNINDHTFIENDVVIGDNVTVKSGVHIWDGVFIEDNAFIGPSVVFTNDLAPRSKQYPTEFAKTIIKKYASIGANVTVVAGNTIGEYAMIGAGSVVTKDIPPYTLWYGNPAQFKGYVCECGSKLDAEFVCVECKTDMKNVIYNLGRK